MKKYLLAFSLFMLMFAGFAVDASAKDMSRRFGIGVDSTISEYHGDGRGLSAIYNINKYFGMQLLFGLNITSADVTTKSATYDSTIIDWTVSLRGLIPFVVSTDVNLTAVVGFTASGVSSDGFDPKNMSDPTQMKYKDGYQFSIDLGVRPEWFVTEHFSLHTQVGIGINIITNDSTSASVGLSSDGTAYYSNDAKGVSVDFFKNVDLFGQAGFTFWF